MRYVVLLLFGSFGVLLFVLGWHKYKEAMLAPVDGVVESPNEPAPAVPRPWTAGLTQEVLVCAGFGCVGLFLGIGGFLSLGSAGALSGETAAVRPTTRTGPVEVRHPQSSFHAILLISTLLFGAAYALIHDPTILWTRWLSWPAGAAACLAGGIGIHHAFVKRSETIHGDDRGITVRSKSEVKQIGWGEVRRLKQVTVTRREYSSTTKSSRQVTTSRYLLLLSGSGETLVRLDDDLVPPEENQRLRAMIRERTRLEVERETKDIPF